MAEQTAISLSGEVRNEVGKGPSRRLRAKGLIPAVVYGQKKEPTHIAVDPSLIEKAIATPHKFNTVIKLQVDGAERTVHLDVASHDGAEPSLQGHSIGHWDGRALVVDTARFIEHRNGTAWSLPSSSRKHLTERFELATDGESLTYSFVLEDPEYLTRPLAADAKWVYRPDLAYHAEPCDPANARRFVPH